MLSRFTSAYLLQPTPDVLDAAQAKVHDRTQEPYHICSTLEPHIPDQGLRMQLAKLLQGMLDPKLDHRLTANQALTRLEEVSWSP